MWLISLRDLQWRRRQFVIAMPASARARARDPSLLLADEPIVHLDYIQVDAVLRHPPPARRARPRRGRATHDERLLPPVDRILELSPRASQAATAPVTRSLQPHEVVFEQGDAGDLVLCR